MFWNFLAAIVVYSWRFRWIVIGIFTFITIVAAFYAATHLDLDADDGKLLAADLPFKQAEDRLSSAFPDSYSDLVVVLDAPSPGQAQDAARKLRDALIAQKDLFAAARLQSGDAFFRRNGLLYLSVEDLRTISDKLTQAQPVLGALARDPTSRGVATLLSMLSEGVSRKETQLMDIEPLLNQVSGLIEGSLKDAPPRPMKMESETGGLIANRAFVMVKPILDFSDLTPGERAADAIRQAARDLNFTPAQGYQLHLTGPVPLIDENFSAVEKGMGLTGLLSSVAVLAILVVAVRNWPLVGAILATLVVGLILTAAFASLTVGTLNPISVAFAVMFIGIAVDFAIQFTVRYLDIRLTAHDSKEAITKTAKVMVSPLSLAAIASAAGFLSFLPTNYQGVSQLGLVAGGGMIIALIVDLTLLPALLRIIRPLGHKEMGGLPQAKMIDGFLARRARWVVGGAVGLAAVGCVLTPRLEFDSNTLHLQSPKSEAVATLMDMARSPDTSPYFIDMLAVNEQTAHDMVERLGSMPEIDHAVTLESFIPDNQPEKLGLIADIADIYGPVLTPEARLPPPDPAQSEQALRQASLNVGSLAPPGTAATDRLVHDLEQLSQSAEATKAFDKRLDDLLAPNLALLTSLLSAGPVSAADLPTDLVGEWITADGQRKVTAWPRENMSDTHAMADFVKAVLEIDPMASGMAVSMVEAGHVILSAFVTAALLSIASISLLLGLILRRILDSLLVILPLVLGGLYTVIGCVLFGLSINFANIIALPLLLGIGVAFNIYFVVNWRAGITDHLGTSTGRAVLFSALTTSSAFGSLAVSPHVGTASMGLLLFLSVGLTVATTFFILPALLHLMPKPNNDSDNPV